MKKFALLIKTIVLSALLATSALAGGERVNINTADAATLDRVLNGIGPSKAEAIVAYRKANGPFRSIDQLASVKGIGLSTIEKNRDRIVIAGGAAVAAAKPAGTGRPAPPKPRAGSGG
ncbi:MAG: ComEA family DNA-binding protein [Frankiaceae bacterium]|nr:ComEA family DNA-binding protein [Arenimonas sp.]